MTEANQRESVAVAMEPMSTRANAAARLSPMTVLRLGASATFALIVLAQLNLGGLGVLWENFHWLVSALTATIVAGLAARGADAADRRLRLAAFAALAVWSAYAVSWAMLVAAGMVVFPSPADALGLAAVIPGFVILGILVRGLVTRAEEIAVYLDAGLVAAATAAILLAAFGGSAYQVGGLAALVAFVYPFVYFTVAGSGLVAFLAVRHPFVPRGGYVLVAAATLLGISFLGWVVPAAQGLGEPGQIFGHLFSLAILLAGYGAATWRAEVSTDPRFVALAAALSRSIGPLATGLVLLVLLVDSPALAPLTGAIRVTALVAVTLFLVRQGLLLRERSLMLAEVRELHRENDRLVDELRAELAERARVQSQLLAASRMAAVGELAAGVAHEVNNPLTGVLGYAEILLEDVAADDPHRPDIETIRDEALRARSIVRALRDFARPITPEKVPTDLAELTGRTVDLLRYQLTKAGVVVTEAHAEMPPVELDPQAIQQVVLNVLTNAVQAMPAGGALRVETGQDGADAVVVIADTGVGMEEPVAAQAFVPFFSDRRSSGAVGLGLSTSLGLVESHAGTIRLESRPGRGTTVEIRLPMAAAAPTAAGMAAAPVAGDAA